MFQSEHNSSTQRILSGAGVGALAGMAMAGWAMVASLANGDGFLKPVQLIAATVYGTDALTLTVPVIATGLVLHMLTSMGLGAALGLFLNRSTPIWLSEALSLAWGIIAWALFTFAVLPQTNTVMHEATDKTPINWFIGHVIFGAVLGLTPIVANWVSTRRFMAEKVVPALV